MRAEKGFIPHKHLKGPEPLKSIIDLPEGQCWFWGLCAVELIKMGGRESCRQHEDMGIHAQLTMWISNENFQGLSHDSWTGNQIRSMPQLDSLVSKHK